VDIDKQTVINVVIHNVIGLNLINAPITVKPQSFLHSLQPSDLFS